MVVKGDVHFHGVANVQKWDIWGSGIKTYLLHHSAITFSLQMEYSEHCEHVPKMHVFE